MRDYLERMGHMHPTFYVPPRAGFECDGDIADARNDAEPSWRAR